MDRFHECFGEIPDPRADNSQHELIEVLFIALLSSLCGATSCSDMADLYGSYNGAMVVSLTEIMPVEVRTSGFSLAYSLATATFGGFTPAVSQYLYHVTDNRAVAGLWLMFAAACGLAAALLAWRPELRARQPAAAE